MGFNLQQLAQEENRLYSRALQLKSSKTRDEVTLQEIFVAYKEVHSQYAVLAELEPEALKRALFLQWYAQVEPSDLSGICELDEDSELKVIQVLDNRIRAGTLDKELAWMLSYYIDWDFVFNRFSSFKSLQEFMLEGKQISFPERIDRVAMRRRGQMGIYWNSLDVFS
ncbi:hypothetical protein TH61_10585 [Rufibacter sp. DG15C]|uniref:hypothetical protein n=1 Tax=Rufibacter sp. DG15C TaxID=1379909 RepID=UPI00078CB9DA|nr:hypothetical protein [Rufibacter sp. DG15C]AMM51529.1 hypothetical protein TH61_10585 [Rufibacter sp. DG15C]